MSCEHEVRFTIKPTDDVENDVFYTNDGTGDFTKGQDI